MQNSKKTLDVVACIITRHQNKIFIARRKPGKFLEGKWEFPGGKVEHNETFEFALKREMMEEFGIKTEINEHILSNKYDYGTFKVHLHSFFVIILEGKIKPVDHDKTAWVRVNELSSFDFVPADLPIIEILEHMLKS